MDRIQNATVAGSIISGKKTGRNPARAAKRPAVSDNKSIKIEEPVDRVATTRQERITVSMDEGLLNLSDAAALTSMAMMGATIGAAVAVSTMMGHIPTAIAVGAGALGGYVLNRTGLDIKIGRALKKGANVAMTPFAMLANGVKKGVKKIFSIFKNDKSKEKAPAGNASIKENGNRWQDNSQKAVVKGKTNHGGADGKITGEDAANASASLIKGTRSMPNILYPSIRGANAAEKAMIMETLDKLPLSDVASCGSVTVNPNLAQDYSASGMAKDLLFTRTIDLDKGYAAIDGFNKEVLIHEIGHTSDFSHLPGPFLGRSTQPPFGKEPFVFDNSIDVPGEAPYSATNRWEDYAQSYQMYHTRPDELKAQTPEKFEAMKQVHKGSLYDKVLDKTGIRKLGKNISQLIDKVPHLRTTLSLLGSFIGPLTIRTASEKLTGGIKENDPVKRFEGKMDFAQGVAYSSRYLSPLGIALTGAKWLLGRRVKKGKMSIEKAEKIAGTFMASMAGPLGMITLAASREMLAPENKIKAGKGERKKFKYTEKSAKDFTKKEKMKQMKLKYYDKIDSKTGKKVKSEDLKLTWDDKKFMAKVATGAAVTGAAGTVGGYVAGAAVGATVGALIGGPLGAAVLGFLGKIGGSMVASYYSAKGGAKLAKMIGKKD